MWGWGVNPACSVAVCRQWRPKQFSQQPSLLSSRSACPFSPDSAGVTGCSFGVHCEEASGGAGPKENKGEAKSLGAAGAQPCCWCSAAPLPQGKSFPLLCMAVCTVASWREKCHG